MGPEGGTPTPGDASDSERQRQSSPSKPQSAPRAGCQVCSAALGESASYYQVSAVVVVVARRPPPARLAPAAAVAPAAPAGDPAATVRRPIRARPQHPAAAEDQGVQGLHDR